MRRPRLRRTLARTGLALCLTLILAAAAISFVCHVDVYFGAFHIGFLCGEVHLIRDKTAPHGLWPISFAALRVSPIQWQSLEWLPRHVNTSRNQIDILPLWIPLALAAVPTIAFWCLNRHRSAPGTCRNCRYDLTGNITGTCPECGATAEPAK